MRTINELIWHCTATPEGREVSVEDIRRWHTDPPRYEVRDGRRVNVGGRGWSDIGYHKVIHLDGSVSEGRPESKVGSHVASRNTGTIGYVYVGGVDDQMRPKDTRTPAQKHTMRRLTEEAIARYGLTKVTGHHDYAAKACPCFPAAREYAPLLRNAGLKVAPVKAGMGFTTFDRDEGMPGKDPALAQRNETIGAGAATAGGGLGTVALLVDDIKDKIEPLTWSSEKIATAFAVLTIVGIGILIWSRIRKR